MNLIPIILLVCSLLYISSPREILKGKVVEVYDGNTIGLLTEENETYKIELANIDCPEPEQPFGDEAKDMLVKSIKGKKVEAFIERKNRWGIRQAVVVPKDGDDPRLKLLAEGLAWTSEKSPDPEFELIRVDAQTHGKGLWKDSNPTPPWIFRRQQTMLTAKSSW